MNTSTTARDAVNLVSYCSIWQCFKVIRLHYVGKKHGGNVSKIVLTQCGSIQSSCIDCIRCEELCGIT